MAKSTIIKELANNQISMEVALQRLMIIASDLENEELAEYIKKYDEKHVNLLLFLFFFK